MLDMMERPARCLEFLGKVAQGWSATSALRPAPFMMRLAANLRRGVPASQRSS